MSKSKREREPKLVILDDMFREQPKSVVSSGNARVKFSNGTYLDIYVILDDGRQAITVSPGMGSKLVIESGNSSDGVDLSTRKV